MESSKYQVGLATAKNNREENQDSGAVAYFENNKYHILRTNHTPTTITLAYPPKIIVGAILCDGLHREGAKSSNAQVDLFIDLLEYQTDKTHSPISRFNERYYSRAKQYEFGATTALLETINEQNQLELGSIGDTRAYLLTEKIHLLTRDHNYQRLLIEKEFRRDITNPKIIDFFDNHEQTEYISMKDFLIPATSRLTKSISPLERHSLDSTLYETTEHPTIIKMQYALCLLTDGAYEIFRDNRKQLEEVLITSKHSQQAAETIINLSTKASEDNATAIVIKRMR